MRILYLCHRFPYPPNKGEKIRAFHQLKALASRHEVDLFTLIDDPVDLQWRGSLATMCRTVVAPRIHRKTARIRALPYLATGTPLTVPCFASDRLARAVRQAASSRAYERVVVYCSAMAQYADIVGGAPLIVDLVDVDSDKWRQYADWSKPPMSWVYRREARSLRRYEQTICSRADAVVVTTDREADLVRNIDENAPVHVVPNGVDANYFSQNMVPRAPAEPAIVFTGDMAYYPNVQAVVYFAAKVLPRIRESVSNVRFLIVGRNPRPPVRRLVQLPGVEVTGFVPDVRAQLSRASVAVAPFQIAAGIQNKIIEAMAYGLPVVATPRAVQGLIRGVAEVVQVGSNAEFLAANCLRLLMHPELSRNLAEAGRKCVMKHYCWRDSMSEFVGLVESTDNLHGVRCGVGNVRASSDTGGRRIAATPIAAQE